MIESFTIISALIAFFSIFFKWSKEMKLTIFWTFIIFLIIFDGLRWEMGTDWPTYYAFFNDILEKTGSGFEIGFTIYTWTIRNLTDNYSIYLLLTTAIIYIGIFYTIFKISNFSFIALFFLTSYIPWYSGSLRQMMATVFFVLALKYVYSQNLFKFLGTMSIGVLFHSTVLPFFFIYWMFGTSLFTFILLGLGLVLVSSIITVFVAQIDFLINVVSGRGIASRIGGTLEDSSPVLGLMRKVITISLSFLFLKTATNTELLNNKLELDKIKFFLYLSLFSLMFYIIGTFFINYISSRLDIFTGIICLAIFLGLIEKHIRSRQHLLYLYVFVVLLSVVFYVRLDYLNLFHPYSSIFYNSDYLRDFNEY